MPPPMSPQGSRAGLITTVVIFAILFVVFTILYINENATLRKTNQQLADTQRQLDQAASAAVRPNVTGIIESRNNAPWSEDQTFTGYDSALEVATAQRDRLARLVAGTDDAATAVTQARALVARLTNAGQQASAAGGGPTTQPIVTAAPNASLVNILQLMAGSIEGMRDQQAQLQQQLADANQSTQQAIQERETQLKAQEQKLAEVQKLADQAAQELEAYRAERSIGVDKLTEGTKAELASLQKNLSESQQEIAARDEKIREQGQQIQALIAKLNQIRIDPRGPITRQEDGIIQRTNPTENIVFINLGQNDQVIRGMTFEVYDKLSGIPPMQAGDEDQLQLPQGKASIEVISVNPGNSTARVIRQNRGETIAEGDKIANLIYDRNVKYNFVVHGAFDMDRDGQATAAEGDQIRQLVTRWGARVADRVSADTDFIVIGAEPQVEQLPENPTPEEIAGNVRQQGELKAYEDILDRAGDLNIPVLNQNRFLFLIGYYSQANR